MSDIHSVYEEKMKKSIAALKDEFNGLRTGRASASLFDKIRVDSYGQPTPLNQVATISIPEARLVVIQPWNFRSILPTTANLSVLQFRRLPRNAEKNLQNKRKTLPNSAALQSAIFGAMVSMMQRNSKKKVC